MFDNWFGLRFHNRFGFQFWLGLGHRFRIDNGFWLGLGLRFRCWFDLELGFWFRFDSWFDLRLGLGFWFGLVLHNRLRLNLNLGLGLHDWLELFNGLGLRNLLELRLNLGFGLQLDLQFRLRHGHRHRFNGGERGEHLMQDVSSGPHRNGLLLGCRREHLMEHRGCLGGLALRLDACSLDLFFTQRLEGCGLVSLELCIVLVLRLCCEVETLVDSNRFCHHIGVSNCIHDRLGLVRRLGLLHRGSNVDRRFLFISLDSSRLLKRIPLRLTDRLGREDFERLIIDAQGSHIDNFNRHPSKRRLVLLDDFVLGIQHVSKRMPQALKKTLALVVVLFVRHLIIGERLYIRLGPKGALLNGHVL